MTDDERFSPLVGMTGASDLWPVRDERNRRAPMRRACWGFPARGPGLHERCRSGRHQPWLPPCDIATALPADVCS